MQSLRSCVSLLLVKRENKCLKLVAYFIWLLVVEMVCSLVKLSLWFGCCGHLKMEQLDVIHQKTKIITLIVMIIEFAFFGFVETYQRLHFV